MDTQIPQTPRDRRACKWVAAGLLAILFIASRVVPSMMRKMRRGMRQSMMQEMMGGEGGFNPAEM